VVWQGDDGNDYELYLWEGGTVTQITTNSGADIDPEISGSNVAWQGYDGNDYEIYFMRGAPRSAELVPSISFGGLALLAGLALGIVAWARQRLDRTEPLRRGLPTPRPGFWRSPPRNQ
jgi:hypothetical protein